MKLIRDGVLIREFTLDDVDKKVEWINNSENNEYLHYDIPLSIQGTTHWFINKDNRSRLDCIIEYNGIPVGVIGLLQIDNINKKAEFYITIGSTEFKRKGIATKATRLILDYAFSELKLHKVYLNVDEKNESACKLYEKVGFKCEGIFVRDMFFRNEWINRRRYAVLNENEVV